MTDKIPIIQETEVKGHIQAHKQLYSFSILPRNVNLPAKMELQVKTDVFNSLRFELDNQLWQFVEDAFLVYMIFLEFKVIPTYKEQFRVAQLNNNIELLRKRCISEWKKQEKIEYQKYLIY